MSGDIQYVIRHTSRFTYSAPISESMMEVRMQPRGDERQRCLRFELTTQPRARVFAYQDPLGNVVHHFDIPSRHSRLWITADAIVDMAPMPFIPDNLPDTTWDDLDALAASGEHWHCAAVRATSRARRRCWPSLRTSCTGSATPIR